MNLHFAQNNSLNFSRGCGRPQSFESPLSEILQMPLVSSLCTGLFPMDCSTSLYYFMLTSFILSLILTMGKVCLLYPLSSKFLNYKRLETFWSIQAVSKTRRLVCESHFKIIFSQEICLFADVPGQLIFSNDQPQDLPGPGGGLVPCYSGSFTSSVLPCLQSCHPNWLTSAHFSLSLPGNQLNLRVGDRGNSGVWSRPSTPGPLSSNTSNSEAGSSLSFRKSSTMHFNL